MTALTIFSGGKVSIPRAADMAKSLRNAAHSGGSGSQLPEGGVYVNFSGKLGKYSIGTEQADADPAEQWLINVFSFEAGYICWKGGAPVAKRLSSIYESPVNAPDPNEHGPFNAARGEGWFTAKGFMMRSLHTGKQGYFTTNTKSALREFGRVEELVAQRIEQGLPAWPVITLGKDQFTAQGQKNWKPVLQIVGWLGMRQVAEMASMASITEVEDNLERLLNEAEDDEANGVLDTTKNGGEDTSGTVPATDVDTDDGDYYDDDDEDVAEDVEDAEDADADEDEDEDVSPEPEPEPEPAPRARVRRPAPAAAPQRRRAAV